MTRGPMEFGTTNNAGSQSTLLTARGASLATLHVSNIGGGTSVLADAGTDGVLGRGTGVGVRGDSFGPAPNIGVRGTSSARPGTGVRGVATGDGVVGFSMGGSSIVDGGIHGFGLQPNGNGVIGEAHSGASAFGVWGRSNTGFAGVFDGKVHVNGTLTKSIGGFKIDHPLDPENKYLFHSFVESPDALNVYCGNATTDEDGTVTVALPDYFEALNQDFCYQLTVIGEPAQAVVAEELRDNRFTIKTDRPNVTVSWQVTGVRKDALANMSRLPVEEEKPDEERGTYLHPEAFGQPESRGAGYAREQELRALEAEMLEAHPLEIEVPTDNPT
jgi:hypothetical protein